MPRNVPMQGIKVWWTEEGDRSKGDDGAGAQAPLGSGRIEEEERIDEWVPRPSR